MLTVKILYFAGARDLVGLGEERLPVDGGDVRAAVAAIVARHPAIEERLPHLRFARNESFAGLDEPLGEGDVIAVIPPVAGG